MSDEKAMAALAHAGMLPGGDDDGDRFAEADMLLMGRPEAVKLEQPGDTCSMVVVDIFAQQAKDFDSGNMKFWPDGRPVMDPVYVGRVDGQLRTLYVGSYRMRNAIRDAVLAAGFDRGQSLPGVRPGGTLVVRFTGFGEPAKKGGQRPKEYEAGYDAPGPRPLGPLPEIGQPALAIDTDPPF